MPSWINSRELASAFWLIVLLLWGLTSRDVRASLVSVLRCFVNRVILITILLTGLYLFGIFTILAGFMDWRPELTKATTVWGVFSGFSLVLHANNDGIGRLSFKNILSDQIKALFLVEFLVNVYSFPLLVEIISLPIVALFAGMSALESYNEDAKKIAPIVKTLLTFYVLILLIGAILYITRNADIIFTTDTLIEFILPIVLLFGFLPFLYFLTLYMGYDSLFRRISCGPQKELKIIRSIKWTLFQTCRFNIQRISVVSNMTFYNIMKVNTKSDLDEMRGVYLKHFNSKKNV